MTILECFKFPFSKAMFLNHRLVCVCGGGGVHTQGVLWSKQSSQSSGGAIVDSASERRFGHRLVVVVLVKRWRRRRRRRFEHFADLVPERGGGGGRVFRHFDALAVLVDVFVLVEQVNHNHTLLQSVIHTLEHVICHNNIKCRGGASAHLNSSF